jgi:hypothetical protein
MSRGLSKYQCEILKQLDAVYLVVEGGTEKKVTANHLTLWDAEKAVWRLRNPKRDAVIDALHATSGVKVSQIANVSALYRMLYSLEKRGLIGMVVGLYPRVWLKLKWDGKGVSVEWSTVSWQKVLFHLTGTKGVLAIRTKGTVKLFDYRFVFKAAQGSDV